MSEYTREDELRDRDDARGCRWCGGKGYILHPGEAYACDPCDCKTAEEEDERTFTELVEEGLAIIELDRDEAQKAAIKTALAGDRLLSIVRHFVWAHDPETASPDPRCLECSLGTTPARLKPRPCAYHEARAILREIGDLV